MSHLCFTDTHVAGGGTSPAIFASTMGSSVIRYTLTLPDPRERLSQINKALIAGKHLCTVFFFFNYRHCSASSKVMNVLILQRNIFSLLYLEGALLEVSLYCSTIGCANVRMP